MLIHGILHGILETQNFRWLFFHVKSKLSKIKSLQKLYSAVFILSSVLTQNMISVLAQLKCLFIVDIRQLDMISNKMQPHKKIRAKIHNVS